MKSYRIAKVKVWVFPSTLFAIKNGYKMGQFYSRFYSTIVFVKIVVFKPRQMRFSEATNLLGCGLRGLVQLVDDSAARNVHKL